MYRPKPEWNRASRGGARCATGGTYRCGAFDQVEVEPTDRSFQAASAFAVDGRFDAYVAVGGGSTIDTAKAANLYATYPAELLDYVTPPVGKGIPVPGALKPLIAVPTTAGTGSETTGVAIFDYIPLHAKMGIAHRALRPVLGVVDPNNTKSVPPQVAACAGLDVLSHAVESLTALPFCERPAPDSPAPPGLPRVQPDQRHLVEASDRDGRALSGPVDDRPIR